MTSKQMAEEVKQKVTIPMYFYQIIVPQMGSYYDVYPVDFDSKPVVCCPLHDEDTPSFRYYENTSSFYCFGCQRGGDVISLHRYYAERMNGTKPSYFEAVQFLYNFFVNGRDLKPFKTDIGILKKPELNSDKDLVKINIYRVNLESSINADRNISFVAKKIIWKALDDIDMLLSKDLISVSDARQYLEETVRKAITANETINRTVYSSKVKEHNMIDEGTDENKQVKHVKMIPAPPKELRRQKGPTILSQSNGEVEFTFDMEDEDDAW